MATVQMNPFALTKTTPPGLPSADQGYGGIIKCITGQLTYAAQTSGTVIQIGTIPVGSQLIAGWLYTDTSTGSTTLAVGGTLGGTQAFQANCYLAAAAITGVDTFKFFFSNVSATHPNLNGQPAPYGAGETISITTAAATAPASGNLYAGLLYM